MTEPSAAPTVISGAATAGQATPITTPVTPVTGSLASVVKPARDLRSLAMRLTPGSGDIPIVANSTPPTYKVGDKARFWVQNEDTQEHRQITATLKVETPHVYMWVEDGVNLDQAALEQSANVFENKTYPTDRQYFGSEWTPGVDNDVHLTILHARGLGRSIAGYFSAADEYSHLANPYSNEREMFYISADSGRAEPGTPSTMACWRMSSSI